MIETNMNINVNDADPLKGFPYGLKDIDAWVVRRKDGSVVRYQMDTPGYARFTPQVKVGTSGAPNSAALSVVRDHSAAGYHAPYYSGSLSQWCKHTPDMTLPTFEVVGPNGPLKVWVADAEGMRKSWREFDFCIDGGNVIGEYQYRPDSKMKSNLAGWNATYSKFEIPFLNEKVPPFLHIDWQDRQAPPLHPKFWMELVKDPRMKGNIVTNCQGGHGRSGSAAVLIMMALSDYTPFDAICHLRAMHCPRAIESKIQHEYLNWAADEMGRAPNAMEAEGVKDYRVAFLTKVKSKFAASAQATLEAKGTTKDTVERD